MNTSFLEKIGANDSLLEWGPKRPPRRQKSPLDAGTWKVATENGRVSVVTSTTNVACRDSRHSLAVASETRTTKSRTRSWVLAAQSAIARPGTGNAVCPPQLGDMESRPISGLLRFAAVGSFGPVRSFWRSTI